MMKFSLPPIVPEREGSIYILEIRLQGTLNDSLWIHCGYSDYCNDSMTFSRASQSLLHGICCWAQLRPVDFIEGAMLVVESRTCDHSKLTPNMSRTLQRPSQVG